MIRNKGVLVTGGAGFIGSHLVEELLKRNNKVVVVDNFSTGKLDNLPKHKNLTIYNRDISLEDLTPIFKRWDFETIFHVAAIPGVQFSIMDPVDTHLSNIDGTFIMLELARKFKIPRFIFSSSSSIYGNTRPGLAIREDTIPNPISPYAAHKLCGEHYCRLYYELYGIKTISLRYFNVFGPRQNPDSDYSAVIPKFIKQIKAGEQINIWNTGNQSRSFVSVKDVVSANILASKTNDKKCFGEAFNIGDDGNISVNEIAKATLMGLGSRLKPLRNKVKVVEPFSTLANLSKSKRLLKWQPEEDFYYRLQELF